MLQSNVLNKHSNRILRCNLPSKTPYRTTNPQVASDRHQSIFEDGRPNAMKGENTWKYWLPTENLKSGTRILHHFLYTMLE